MTTCIDLFAGAGGFSAGARLAGAHVLWAANHWPTAVQWHTSNHPGTTHACQDLQQADFRCAPAHDILLASPACQGHSRARGSDKPHHAAQRATAWAVDSYKPLGLDCDRAVWQKVRELWAPNAEVQRPA